MSGLNFGVFLVRKQFNNMFLIIVRESSTPLIQKYLLKLLLQNILDGDKNYSNKGSYRFIEIACTLLEDFCSDREDTKKLITKQDINDIINLEILFEKIIDML